LQPGYAAIRDVDPGRQPAADRQRGQPDSRRKRAALSFVDFARSGLPLTLLSMAAAGLWLGYGGWLPW
jgi:hypothetical protein